MSTAYLAAPCGDSEAKEFKTGKVLPWKVLKSNIPPAPITIAYCEKHSQAKAIATALNFQNYCKDAVKELNKLEVND
jgi:hypothetical protein